VKVRGWDYPFSLEYPHKEVPVVLFTGHGDLNSAIDALRAGAYDYLLKPININELAVLVESIDQQRHRKKEGIVLGGKPKRKEKETGKTVKDMSLEQNHPPQAIMGEIGIFSDAMRDIFKQAEKLHGDRSIPVLIQGETGTGKEVVAKYIHYGRDGVSLPFVDINCAAIPPGIFESEFFGYEAGAFTGGLRKGQKGKLDLAHGGTIFLDEISELPLELQSKLLRVIQEKEYYRVGGLKKIETDLRFICATNMDIEKGVQEGQFRQDLFYRLNTGRIIIPPLRDRQNEILPLATMFLNRFTSQKGKRFAGISDKAAKVLQSYTWPGNVRELMNVVEYIVFMYDDNELKLEHLNNLPQFKNNGYVEEEGMGPVVLENFSLPPDGLDLTQLNDNIIIRALEMHNGNKTKTAAYLGITRRVLQYRLKRLEGD